MAAGAIPSRGDGGKSNPAVTETHGAAKGKKGGSWDKAEALELIPSSSSTMLSGGMAALMG